MFVGIPKYSTNVELYFSQSFYNAFLNNYSIHSGPQTLHIIFNKLVHFLIAFLEIFKHLIFTEKCINAFKLFKLHIVIPNKGFAEFHRYDSQGWTTECTVNICSPKYVSSTVTVKP